MEKDRVKLYAKQFPLHVAVVGENRGAVAKIAREGSVDPDAVDINAETVVSACALHGWVHSLKEVFRFFPDVIIRDTDITLAERMEHINRKGIAKILKEHKEKMLDPEVADSLRKLAEEARRRTPI